MTTTLITGANRGIGLELTKQLREAGHEIIAVCRKTSAELEQLDVQIEPGIDVASEQGMLDLHKRLSGKSLDWLIANAGILRPDTLDSMDFDAAIKQFEVNALGALRTVHGLLPYLHAGSKIALITSRMGSISDNSSGHNYGYRMSKAALNAAGKSLARDLEGRGIAVAILHPGYVRTDMTGRQGGVDPSEAARALIARIEALDLSNTGTFWHANGEVLPW